MARHARRNLDMRGLRMGTMRGNEMGTAGRRARSGVEFDSPGGRIVTAVASSGAGQQTRIEGVRAFYRKALPPLGWRHISGDTYRREGERLTLRISIAGAGVVVRVRLVPAGRN